MLNRLKNKALSGYLLFLSMVSALPD